jgi:hypothetical protein
MSISTRFVFSPANCCSLILSLLLFSGLATAQAVQHSDSNSTATSSVRLIADARLEVLAHYNDAPKSTSAGVGVPTRKPALTGSIRSVPGFRVIIYSGTDRNKANGAKLDFMRRFPGMRVYMSYAMPQYRVKVGDFTSRSEASGLYQQLNKVYSPCLIVPDIVEINTFHRANDTANPAKEP